MAVVDSSDLKTASLIGFAVLGLRWASHPSLEPVRHAIRSGDALDPRHGSVGKFLHSDKPAREREVLIVFEPHRSVHVMGIDGHGAKFPFFDDVDLRFSSSGAVQADAIRWPRIREHQSVAEAFTNGELFLLDHPDAASDIRRRLVA